MSQVDSSESWFTNSWATCLFARIATSCILTNSNLINSFLLLLVRHLLLLAMHLLLVAFLLLLAKCQGHLPTHHAICVKLRPPIGRRLLVPRAGSHKATAGTETYRADAPRFRDRE